MKKSAQELFSDLDMNQTTINALNEFYEMKEHPEKYKRYSSFKEAMTEVLGDA